jgi:hypothetical protein
LFYLASADPIDDVFSVITLSYLLTLSSNNEIQKKVQGWLLRKSCEAFPYELLHDSIQ